MILHWKNIACYKLKLIKSSKKKTQKYETPKTFLQVHSCPSPLLLFFCSAVHQQLASFLSINMHIKCNNFLWNLRRNIFDFKRTFTKYIKESFKTIEDSFPFHMTVSLSASDYNKHFTHRSSSSFIKFKHLNCRLDSDQFEMQWLWCLILLIRFFDWFYIYHWLSLMTIQTLKRIDNSMNDWKRRRFSHTCCW